MKKIFYHAVKTAVKRSVIKTANTTSSFIAHQPKAPKGIEKYKK